jgi:hypothetical protein
MGDERLIGNTPDFSTLMSTLGSVQETAATKVEKKVEEETVWIQKAEKALEHDKLALALPVPVITPGTLLRISTYFADNFSIGRLGTTDSSQSFGVLESSVILAAVGEWAKGQGGETTLVTELLTNDQKNPVDTILNKYVSSAQTQPVDALQAQLALRNVPVIPAILKQANKNLLEKAFSVAYSQLVLAMLDKWNEFEAQRAAAAREQAKKDDITAEEAAREILRDYIKDAAQKKQALAQPALSIAYAAAFFSPILVSAVGPTQITEAVLASFHSIPKTLQVELGALAAGCVSTAMSWSLPVIISLAQASHSSGQQLGVDAAKSFAMSLVTMLQSPSVQQLVTSRIEHAVANGTIGKERVTYIHTIFTTALLLHATAMLYYAQHGGVTGAEIKGILDGTVKLKDDNFLTTLAKLINYELSGFSTSEKESILKDLLQVYDRPTSAEPITDPIQGFAGMWDPSFFREAALAENA